MFFPLTAGMLLCQTCFDMAAAQGAQLEPTIHGPYLQQIADDGATISWTTDKPTAAWIELWKEGHPNQRTIVMDAKYGLKRLGTNSHQVTVWGLQPGERYQYKVYAGDRGKQGDPIKPGNEPADGTFRTLNSNGDRCSIFIANDIHGDSKRFLDLMDQHVKVGETDFCVLNGDSVSWLSGKDQLFKVIVDPAQKIIKDVPIVYVRGNHEYRGGNAINLPDTFLPQPNGEYYGLLRQGPVCFVILDSGEDKADTRKELGGVTQFEPYLAQQAEWLKKAVECPEFKSALYRVVIVHIPFAGEKGFAEDLLRKLFVPTLAKAGVNIAISAHTHYNVFVPGGKEPGIPFPVLVNDNQGAITLTADSQKMEVIHYDRHKKILRTERFSPNQF